MEVRHHCLFESCMNFLKTFICPALLTVFSPDRHVLKATDFDHLYAPMKLHMKQECTFKKKHRAFIFTRIFYCQICGILIKRPEKVLDCTAEIKRFSKVVTCTVYMRMLV